ncbi:MAG: hypothetical protein ACXWG8_07805 [Usitatibacter sp.]
MIALWIRVLRTQYGFKASLDILDEGVWVQRRFMMTFTTKVANRTQPRIIIGCPWFHWSFGGELPSERGHLG